MCHSHVHCKCYIAIPPQYSNGTIVHYTVSDTVKGYHLNQAGYLCCAEGA